MGLTFDNLLALLNQASTPEEIFGPPGSDLQAGLKQRYRELAGLAHPDNNPARSSEAHQAFTTLRRWYEAAQQKAGQGFYGANPRFTVASPRQSYTGYVPALRGELCELYPSPGAEGRLLLKVARSGQSNELLAAEAQALQQFEQELEGQKLRAHFPLLVEHFRLRDGAGVQRHVNVLRAELGVYTLAEVQAAYPQGLDPADAAWIFNRMLAALGTAHSLGLAHGAVTLEHVLVRPADHNGMLIDWCYSVPAGEPLRALSEACIADYPPELRAHGPVTPASDLFMAARCIARLMGSDGSAEGLPARVPRPIRALLQSCLIPAPTRRHNDAWQLFDEFQELLRELYGPPRFRPFVMPAS